MQVELRPSLQVVRLGHVNLSLRVEKELVENAAFARAWIETIVEFKVELGEFCLFR